MPIEHLRSTSSADTIHEILTRDGCAVIDGLASAELLDRIETEMGPHEATNHFGREKFTGLCTKRTGALVTRSPTTREVVMHPTILEMTKRLLHDATREPVPGGPGRGRERTARSFAASAWLRPRGLRTQQLPGPGASDRRDPPQSSRDRKLVPVDSRTVRETDLEICGDQKQLRTLCPLQKTKRENA